MNPRLTRMSRGFTRCSPLPSVGDGSEASVGHDPGVLGERACRVEGSWCGPGGQPLLDLVRRQLDVDLALGDVDGDRVAVLEDGDGTALHCFRHDVADAESATCAAE